ncbi:sigma 54-interacting transcriptional regulator [Vibrio astriarenae]
MSGISNAIDEVNRKITRYAACGNEVLIFGETGVGKSRCAQLIHQQSMRSSGPLIELNCSSIPRGLVESELFGHEKGAFTGAIRKHAGYIKRAHRGTLFLDEVNDLPLEVQGHLLHFLESKSVHSVGSDNDDLVDCRIVAATNQCLESLIERKEFRADLYYRLNVLPLRIPALRERPEDILPLANDFLRQLGGQQMMLSASSIDALQHHHWHGNIRELKNVICRATILSSGNAIEPEHLMLSASSSLNSIYHDNVASMLEQTIRQHKFNLAATARTLNISRPTLYRLIKKHSINLDPA